MAITLPTPIQYLTQENGERVGVVLRWEDYQMLRATFPIVSPTKKDSELLTGLSISELHTLAASALTAASQERLAELLARNQEQVLTEAEEQELDRLLESVSTLNLLKAPAQYALQHSV